MQDAVARRHPGVRRVERQASARARAEVGDQWGSSAAAAAAEHSAGAWSGGLARRGVTAIHLGIDDVEWQTGVSGNDLYPDVPGHVRRIGHLDGHTQSFCDKLALVVIGAMPDASGPAPTSSWPSE